MGDKLYLWLGVGMFAVQIIGAILYLSSDLLIANFFTIVLGLVILGFNLVAACLIIKSVSGNSSKSEDYEDYNYGSRRNY